MPSQREVRKRRIRASQVAPTPGRGYRSRRGRQRRIVVGAVAIIVALMMVASLAVGLVSLTVGFLTSGI